jgi:MacB-like periplasmic core domain
MRSVLTVLGITIGIAAVIRVVAIGKAGQARVEQQLNNRGGNFVWIEAGGRAVNGVRTGTRGTKTLVMAKCSRRQESDFARQERIAECGRSSSGDLWQSESARIVPGCFPNSGRGSRHWQTQYPPDDDSNSIERSSRRGRCASRIILERRGSKSSASPRSGCVDSNGAHRREPAQDIGLT